MTAGFDSGGGSPHGTSVETGFGANQLFVNSFINY
jgi:hypothetical protein